MSTIDNRVVQMRFDNAQFERGIGTSIKSLDSLKKGLNLQGSAKSLSELSRASKSFSLAGMANHIENISNKFSALGIIGVTVLQNLTNSALNAGISFVKSLSLDPIMDGFSEYETKMGAIQTILTNTANKGTTLENINDALGELNEYSDQTIYNFAQMTDNVGKFTAAGLGLEDSVTTVKGLANVAAGFGVDATKMAAATYQMSQALSAGVVKLQDWNSLQQAGMGGEMIQDELRKTAKEMGVFVDANVPFRETLEKGWLSSEIFVRTMDKMAKDKSLLEAATNVTTFTKLLGTMQEAVGSGWASTWEKIIGDKDQSTKLFTGISNAFGKIVGESADARNSMLDFWNANEGRTYLLQGISNILISISKILAPIEKAFSTMFPAMTGKQLVDLTKGFRDFTANLKIGAGTAENIRKTFAGLFAVIDIGKKILTTAVTIIGTILKAIFPVSGGFLAATASIGDFLVWVNKLINDSNIFTKVIDKVTKIIGILKKTLSSVTVDSEVFMSVIAKIKANLLNMVNLVQKVIDNIKIIFSSLSTKTLNQTTAASNALGGAFDNLASSGARLKNSLLSVGDGVIKAVLPALQKTGAVLKSVFGPSLEVMINKLKQLDLSGVGQILAGGGIIILATTLKSAIDSIKGVTAGFNGVIEGITGTLEAFQTKLKAEALLKIAFAIGLLSVAILALSMIKSEDLSKALSVLSVLFIELSVSIMILQKATFSAFGISVTLMSLGVAILLLAAALTKMSEIDHDKMLQGIQGLSALMTVLALFTKVTSGVQSGTLGLIGISVGILIMSVALERIGAIDSDKLQQGISGIAASLMSLALFIKIIGDPRNMLTVGLGIVAISAALYLIAGSIAIFGHMDLTTLSLGITALAASLMVISVAARAMTGAVSGAAAMLIMAAAINIITPAIAILGNLDIKTIGIALLALAGVFTVLGLAGLILTPLSPIILTLSASIGVLGAGVYLLGGGLVLFAAGIAAFAAGGTVMIAALTGIIMSIINLIPIAAKKLGEGFVAFLTVIRDSIPSIMETIKAVFAAIIEYLRDVLPVLVDAVLEFITVLATKVDAALPKLISLGYSIIKSFLKGIGENIEELTVLGINVMLGFLAGLLSKLPDMIKMGANIVVAFLDGLSKELPRLIEAALKFIVAFLTGLADALRENMPLIVNAVSEIAKAILGGLKDGLLGGLSALKDVGGDVIDGLLQGIKNSLGDVVKAGLNLGVSLLNSAKKALGINSPSKLFAEIGNNITKGLTKGITDNSKSAVNASENMSKNVTNATNKAAKQSTKVVKQSNESAKKSFQASLDWIDERKYYNQLSLSEELAAWQHIQAQYLAGTEERKKADREAYRVKNEIAKAELELAEKVLKAGYAHSTEWIQDKKYYNQLSLTEELAAWERVQARYLAGTEERKNADKEVYRLKNELQKASFENSMRWIDEEKFYNRMGLTEELAAWERVQSRYAVGTEDRKKADKEVYRLKKDINATNEEYSKKVLAVEKETNKQRIKLEEEYYNKTTEINEKLKQDIKGVNDEYEKALESRTSSLYSSFGLFDKIENPQKEIDKKLAGLQEELYEAKKVQNQYKVGSEDRQKADKETLRIADEIKETEAERVTGSNLLQNLKDQVTEFDFWQKSINELVLKGVDGGLIKELEQLGPKSKEQIQALNQLSSPELNEYVSLWKRKYNEANTQALGELEGMRRETAVKIAALTSESATELDKYTEMWNTQMTNLRIDAVDQLDILKDEWSIKIGELRTDTEQDFVTLTNSIENIMANPNWSELGANIVKGMAAGVKASSWFLSDSVNVVGAEAMTSLKNSISNMSEVVDGSMSINPTIKPVLDLTDIKSGNKEINSLLADSKVITPSNKSLNLIGSISNMQPVQNRVANQNSNPTSSQSITNSFAIENLNVREEADVKLVARELYQLQVSNNRGGS